MALCVRAVGDAGRRECVGGAAALNGSGAGTGGAGGGGDGGVVV